MKRVANLRQFPTPIIRPMGRLPRQPYLAATIRYRERFSLVRLTIEGIAAKEKLNAKYLGSLWKTLDGQ